MQIVAKNVSLIEKHGPDTCYLADLVTAVELFDRFSWECCSICGSFIWL